MAAFASSLDSIECSAQPLDLSFHPEREHLVAAALVDGTLEVHDFEPRASLNNDDSDNDDTIVSSIPVHTQKLFQEQGKPQQASCRAVRFSSDGTRIYTGGSAGDVCALDTEVACTFQSPSNNNHKKNILWRTSVGTKEHNGIHALHQLPSCASAGSLLVTGDEEGCIRLWDERLCCGKSIEGANKRKLPKGCVMSWEDNQDYISGFDHNADGTTLLASSADCTLSVLDLRKASDVTTRREALRRSDNQEDELLSVAVLKHGKKVVCGTQEGVLAVWSWGTWGDVSDRFPGHPASIDAILKVDEDTILTGSSDGLVRVVQIHPDKLLGVLGDHDGFPIEKLQFNANRSHVGSVSHDSMIRLWDARILNDDDDDDIEEDEADDVAMKQQQAASLPQVTPAANALKYDSDGDWEDMDEEEDMEEMSDEDSDDDDSEEEDRKPTKQGKMAGRFKSDNEKFFEDL